MVRSAVRKLLREIFMTETEWSPKICTDRSGFQKGDEKDDNTDQISNSAGEKSKSGMWRYVQADGIQESGI